MDSKSSDANLETRDAWNANAAFWDNYMGDAGNDFVNVLIWPAVKRLLSLQPGERVLDIACGNGLYAHRLAALGAEVAAFDFASDMIAQARRRSTDQAERITFSVLDATDEAALLALGEGQFDAAVCLMALMDMAEIDPLLRTLPRLLRPGGRFVFAVTHPCFNSTSAVHVGEMEDRAGTIVTTYSVKVSQYMTPSTAHGLAIRGQPKPQLYFDRPLHALLGAAFAAGFVVDALEERAFPPDHPAGRNPLAWGANFSEIPAVLIARLRHAGPGRQTRNSSE
jgi:2-polyprenyl-3-methyl-5-hydroxy-6-metoxy-1,4-benzoquinol methylase